MSLPGEPGVREVGRRRAGKPDRAVAGWDTMRRRQRVAVGVAGREGGSSTGHAGAVEAVRSLATAGAVGIAVVAARTVVAGVAADLEAAPERAGCRTGAQRATSRRRGQHGAAVVGAVTGAARRAGRARRVLVAVDPRLPDRVHAVRAAGDRRRHGDVAGGALRERADVTLQREALQVVVAVRRRGTRRGSSRGSRALQPAVAGREAVERDARRRACWGWWRRSG